jgi:hypothetical protein
MLSLARIRWFNSLVIAHVFIPFGIFGTIKMATQGLFVLALFAGIPTAVCIWGAFAYWSRRLAN